jgi:hypothetical protein
VGSAGFVCCMPDPCGGGHGQSRERWCRPDSCGGCRIRDVEAVTVVEDALTTGSAMWRLCGAGCGGGVDGGVR